jgi:cytochrome bd-type quinol oxidase subunit 2
MSAIHLHLLLNHVPVLGTFFALGLLLFGLMRKSEELKKTAIGTIVIAALISIPVYLSGESAADSAKNLPGVTESVVESHDNAAAIAFTTTLVIGIFGLVGLLKHRNRLLPAWYTTLMVAILIINAGLMAWTANLGGQIRHTEIRSGSVTTDTLEGDDHD